MKTNVAKAKALDEAERAYRAYKACLDRAKKAKQAFVEAERVYKEAWRACKEEQGELARRRRGDAT